MCQEKRNKNLNKDTEDVVAQSKEIEKKEDILELIEEAPEEEKDKIIEMAFKTHYSGPIPPPELLKEFDNIIPNGADRILKLAENQSSHRQEVEKSIVNAKNRDSFLGVLFAGIMGIIGLLGGIFLIYQGHSVVGSLFSGGTLVSLVGVYLRGTKNDLSDLEEKRDGSNQKG